VGSLHLPRETRYFRDALCLLSWGGNNSWVPSISRSPRVLDSWKMTSYPRHTATHCNTLRESKGRERQRKKKRRRKRREELWVYNEQSTVEWVFQGCGPADSDQLILIPPGFIVPRCLEANQGKNIMLSAYTVCVGILWTTKNMSKCHLHCNWWGTSSPASHATQSLW